MDIAATGTGPWLALAVVLGIGGLALAAAVVAGTARGRRSSAGPTASAGAERFPDDDLADFLERPPGSPERGAHDGTGWTVLSAPPAVAPPVAAGSRRARRLSPLPAAVVATLLLVAAAVSAGVAAADRTGADRRTRRTGAEAADLTFGGVVLERHVVGVTATYPRVRLTGGPTNPAAHVELPTWNCLATAAPADPETAGCTRAVPEYADLRSPALAVARSADGRLRISGRFPTYTRPNGTPPAPTGRVYELVVTVAPAGGARTGRVPASGELRLGSDSTRTTDVSVLRLGG